MHFLSDFNSLLCLPSFSAFSLSFLFFFHPPPSLPLVPERNDPRPAGTGWWCCWEFPVPALPTSVQLLSALRRIWNGLLAASGRLMGNEVQRERGHGEVGGQQRGFGWLGVGSKLKDACDKRHIIYNTSAMVMIQLHGFLEEPLGWALTGQSIWSLEGLTTYHAVTFSTLGNLWSFASLLNSLPHIRKLMCFCPQCIFLSPLFFRPFLR